MNESLIVNIRAYAAERQLQIAEPLGSGKDGIVLVGKSKIHPAKVAIKAHRFLELYLRERGIYQRLGEREVSAVLGFNVPQLLGSDDELQIIEMTIVKRPLFWTLPELTSTSKT